MRIHGIFVDFLKKDILKFPLRNILNIKRKYVAPSIFNLSKNMGIACFNPLLMCKKMC